MRKSMLRKTVKVSLVLLLVGVVFVLFSCSLGVPKGAELASEEESNYWAKGSIWPMNDGDDGCVVLYDFNTLIGSDTLPFADPNGQDNWTSVGFIHSALWPSWFVGVTKTLGFDGTQALRFERVGSGYGADASRLNDTAFSFPSFGGGVEKAYFQADFGVGYWGNEFALGYDTNLDGEIRKTGPSEIGPRLNIGGNSPLVGVQVINANGFITKVPIGNVNAIDGHWVRLRLMMDFVANGGQGSGDVFFQNLTNGDTSLQPVTGLQNINLGLNPSASDASNPELWNAMWNHMEGKVNQLDNIVIGKIDTTAPSIDLSMDPDTLWPPNHKLVKVTTVSATYNCDSDPTLTISVTHNENPHDNTGTGDGNTDPDWQIDSDGSVWVRAERDGTGTGRIYTISVTATDDSGNSATASATVTVPHDMGNNKKK